MFRSISRRGFLGSGAASLAALALPGRLRAPGLKIPMMVYKDPGCACCSKWVDHVRAAGFEVAVHDTSDMTSIKRRYKVADAVISCHTALAGGYVIEGHVPADLVQKLLRDKPRVVGLAVPGMVTGSPGMEGPTKEAYEVLAFDAAGKTTVYARR